MTGPDAGAAPLEAAVRAGRADAVRALVRAGEDPRLPLGEYHETTPLCLAASLGRLGVADAVDARAAAPRRRGVSAGPGRRPT
ncbi:hypothetical protein [Streptomyces sp. NPDC093225]|uniref:hypothetical protein n=1 Tax=Streptomyces sp. NPDC093225 TaxID=3366034 RepID=UPI0038237903